MFGAFALCPVLFCFISLASWTNLEVLDLFCGIEFSFLWKLVRGRSCLFCDWAYPWFSFGYPSFVSTSTFIRRSAVALSFLFPIEGYPISILVSLWQLHLILSAFANIYQEFFYFDQTAASDHRRSIILTLFLSYFISTVLVLSFWYAFSLMFLERKAALLMELSVCVQSIHFQATHELFYSTS